MNTQDFSTLTHISAILTDVKMSEALTKWFGEEVKFTHWEYIDEAGKGDAYLSDLIRIKIHGTSQNGNKHIQVILKTAPKSISRQLTFRNFEFFRNEINFYEKVLPVLLKFQSEKTMTDPFDKYAKVFLSHTDGSNDVLSLEDVSVYNFGSAIRQEGIDLEHCRLTLKALAQFHAISFAMRDQKPELLEEIRHHLTELYYDECFRDWYQRFWNRISGIAVDAVEKEYPNTIYEEKIKKFAVPERYSDMIHAATKTVKNGVISHGDSWTNNFLYKYENNKPVDAKIIDFQLSRCATPILDISFVFNACTTQDLRLKYYDELIDYYYEILSKQIRELGSDPDKVYSRSLYMEELKKYSFFGLAFSFESTPMIVLAPEDAVDMEMKGDQKLNIDDVWQIQPFKTKEGRLREANNVVFAVDRGYI